MLENKTSLSAPVLLLVLPELPQLLLLLPILLHLPPPLIPTCGQTGKNATALTMDLCNRLSAEILVAQHDAELLCPVSVSLFYSSVL